MATSFSILIATVIFGMLILFQEEISELFDWMTFRSIEKWNEFFLSAGEE